MTVNAIKFPVIWFEKYFLRIRYDEPSLTTTTKAGLKHGLFTNLLIVDSNYFGFTVKSAKKLYGIGLFWGYNIFLNQKIKVELNFEGEPRKASLEEVKKRISKSFQKWHGWSTRGDFEELQGNIKNAQSILEIIQLLSEQIVHCRLWG